VKPRLRRGQAGAVANEVRALDARARQIRASYCRGGREETEAVREALAMADTPVIISSGPAVLAEHDPTDGRFGAKHSPRGKNKPVFIGGASRRSAAVFSIYASRFMLPRLRSSLKAALSDAVPRGTRQDAHDSWQRRARAL